MLASDPRRELFLGQASPQRGRPGALAEAQRYLTSLRNPVDTFTLSAAAVERLEQSRLAYQKEHPFGDWGATETSVSDAGTALAVITASRGLDRHA